MSSRALIDQKLIEGSRSPSFPSEKQMNDLFTLFSKIVSDQQQMSLEVKDLSTRVDGWDALVKLEKE